MMKIRKISLLICVAVSYTANAEQRIIEEYIDAHDIHYSGGMIISNVPGKDIYDATFESDDIVIRNGGEVFARYVRFHTGANLLTIRDGGLLNIVSNALVSSIIISGKDYSDATMIIDNGTVNITGHGITVGGGERGSNSHVGNGFLHILNGGVLNVHNDTQPEIIVGGGARSDGIISEGYLYVDGKGSQINTNGVVGLGDRSESLGFVSVTNGGEINANRVTIGGISKHDNMLIIDGSGSSVNSNEFRVGSSGNGTAIVRNEAILNVDNEFVIGRTANASGELAIGSRLGEKAARAGYVETDSIRFGPGSGVLTFNHLNTDYEFSSSLTHFSSVTNSVINIVSGETVFTGNNAGYKRNLVLYEDGILSVANQNNLSSATIENNGTLRINSDDSWNFVNTLSGSGVVEADTGGNYFTFNSASLTQAFTGTLALLNSTFDLTLAGAEALRYATLRAGEGSFINAAYGHKSLGGLAFDGGTVHFGDASPGTSNDASITTTGNLDLTGTGTVQVDISQAQIPHSDLDTSQSIFAQDDGNILMKLVSAEGAVIGDGGNLVLTDIDGNVITDSVTTNMFQNGLQVANATYDYRLTGGEDGDGLYINYGLTAVELLTRGLDALVLNADGATGNLADLSARISGAGDLAVDTGEGQIVSLSNKENDYTGITDVRSGSLLMRNDNVLGNTSDLRLAGDTALYMNGYSQSLAQLNAATDSLVHLGGGSLEIREGGTVDGMLAGSGTLTVAGGELDISSDNSLLSAAISIAEDSIVTLTSSSGMGLGTGNIALEGELNYQGAESGYVVGNLSGEGDLNLSESSLTLTGDNSEFSGSFSIDNQSVLSAMSDNSLGTAAISNEGALRIGFIEKLSNIITGSGSLTKTGGGVTTMTQDAANYTGDTRVEQGGLILGDGENEVTLASGQVTVGENGLFGGYGGTAGSIDNQGVLRVGGDDLARSGGDTEPVTFTVGEDLTNSGTVMISTPGRTGAGNLLHILGDYHGNGGMLAINTVLGGDDSMTDRMLVEGNTSGTTAVAVTNAGGTGAKTLDGIEIITVKGDSAGEFTKSGRIVAGAYDYWLARGEGDNWNNWFLSSTEIPQDDSTAGILRPEGGSYLANLTAANSLFNLRYHDRAGEHYVTDPVSGEQHVTRMWLRNEGGHQRSRDASGQLKTQANRYVMQLGADVARWQTGGDSALHLGLMGGYARQQATTQNNFVGYRSRGTVSGQSLGLYGSWQQDAQRGLGGYVDAWAQHSWFKGSIKGDEIAGESYHLNGMTASLETGYTWHVADRNEREQVFIRPQAQVTWQGVKSGAHKEHNGTQVHGKGHDNIQTRAGARLFINGYSTADSGTGRAFSPYVEANWIHNSKTWGATLDGVPVSQAGGRNLGELKTGLEAKLSDRTQLHGHVAQQSGKGFSDTRASLGLRVTF